MLPASPVHAGPEAALAVGAVAGRTATRPRQLAGRARPPRPVRVASGSAAGRAGESSPHATSAPSRSGTPSASPRRPDRPRLIGRQSGSGTRASPVTAAVTMLREPEPPRRQSARPTTRPARRRRRRRTQRHRPPHATTSPARSASTAGPSVAGRPRQLGRASAARGAPSGRPGPVPAARCHAHADGDRRRQHRGHRPRVGAGQRAGRERRDAREPGAGVVDDGLDDPRLVGDEHLRHEQVGGPAPHRRREPPELDGRTLEAAAAERDRPARPSATVPGRSGRS